MEEEAEVGDASQTTSRISAVVVTHHTTMDDRRSNDSDVAWRFSSGVVRRVGEVAQARWREQSDAEDAERELRWRWASGCERRPERLSLGCSIFPLDKEDGGKKKEEQVGREWTSDKPKRGEVRDAQMRDVGRMIGSWGRRL